MRKRSYRQYCGLAKALDVVGQRWTLLIVRNLLLGPLRYTDLWRGLPGITTNLLAERLKEMEAADLVERVRTHPPSASDAYVLTPRGEALEPAIHALGGWGWEYMKRPARGDATDPAWGMLALKRRYEGIEDELTVHLGVDDRSFTVECFSGGVEIQRGKPLKPDVELAGSFAPMRDLLFRGTPAVGLINRGALACTGSRQSLRRFLRAFGLR